MSAVDDSVREVFSIRAAADHAPRAIALVDRRQTLTYGEAARRAAATSVWLAKHLKKRAPVAVVATLRVDTVLAFHALFEIGIPIVPIHPRLTATERAALVAVSGAGLVLDEDWRAPPPVDGESTVWFDGLTQVDEETPLAIVFTSGSTGAPKGVELSRRAFRASAEASAQNLPLAPSDRWLLCMPLAHVGGLSVVTRCLAARATVVLSPWAGDVDRMLEDVSEQKVTLLSLVPTMLARILAEPGRRFPAAVRAVLLGGDAASPGLLETAAARSVPVLTTYGMTEACSQIATQTYGTTATADAGVGPPLAGVDVRIVDGEIEVRGPTLFTRYLGANEGLALSGRREGGWFATGDRGRIDEAGRLHVTGRRSDVIITGGENVDPREVEVALVAHDGVREACVFGVPDERWGQVVCAALVLERSDDPNMRALAAHVSAVLAPHKRPRRIAFVDALPLFDAGKIDRRRIATALADRLVGSGWR